MEKKEIVNFVNSNLYNMLEYREHLNGRANKVLGDYEKYFTQLEISDDSLTAFQREEMDIYHGMLDDISERKNRTERNSNVLILSRRNDKISAGGFINILLYLTLIVLIGVTVGGLIFIILN